MNYGHTSYPSSTFQWMLKTKSNISLAATSVRIICKESSGEFHPSINFQTRTLGSFDSFGVSWWPFLCRDSTVWEKFGMTIIATHEVGSEKSLGQNCKSHTKSSKIYIYIIYRSNCKSFSISLEGSQILCRLYELATLREMQGTVQKWQNFLIGNRFSS